MRCPFLSVSSTGSTSLVRSVFQHELPIKSKVDVLYFPPLDEKLPKRLVVFFPGNPGLVDYYIPFLTSLRTYHSSRSTAFIAISHVGHCPSLPHPPRPLTLNEQVEAKCEFVSVVRAELDALRRDEGEGQEQKSVTVGLMGHSVGADICVRVDRRLRDGLDTFSSSFGSTTSLSTPSIHALFLLFPTLAQIAQSPNGRRLRPMFNAPLILIVPWLSLFLRPIFYVLLVLSRSTNVDGSSSSSSIYAPNPTTLSFLLSPRTISNVLHLAASEMDSILEPDLTWYAREKGRIWSYWGVNDGWVGDRSEELKMVLGGDQLDGGGVDRHVVEDADERGIDRVASDQGQVVDCVDNVPHAFCLAHSDVIADKVGSWLKVLGRDG